MATFFSNLSEDPLGIRTGGFNPSDLSFGFSNNSANNSGINIPNLTTDPEKLKLSKFALGADVLQGLGNAFLGLKTYGLAKDQFNFAKNQFASNYNAQVQQYNTQLAERAAIQLRDYLRNPSAYAEPPPSVEEYVKQNGLPFVDKSGRPVSPVPTAQNTGPMTGFNVPANDPNNPVNAAGTNPAALLNFGPAAATPLPPSTTAGVAPPPVNDTLAQKRTVPASPFIPLPLPQGRGR